jgi:hypothetical protein
MWRYGPVLGSFEHSNEPWAPYKLDMIWLAVKYYQIFKIKSAPWNSFSSKPTKIRQTTAFYNTPLKREIVQI